MNARARYALLLSLAACGPGAGDLTPTLATTVSGLQSMDVFVVEATSTTGTPVTCATLTATPLAEQTNLIAVYHQFLPFTNAKFDAIPSGSKLLIAIDAYTSADGTGTRVANACQANVSVAVGKTTNISLTLHAAD